MGVILAIAGTAVCLSFVFSLLEATLLSLSSAHVETFHSDRRSGAQRFAILHDRVDEPLGALFLLRVMTQVGAAVWCGSLLATAEAPMTLTGFAVGFASLLFLASSLFGRCLGTHFGGSLARFAAWPLQVLIWSLWPIVKLYALLARILRGRGHQRVPTEDEIMFLSRLALQNGRLRPQELRWVENALRLDEVRVSELMTPRTVVYTLPADLPLSEVKHRSEHWTHSRLPLTEDRDPDRILGMVLRREVFDAIVKGKPNQTLRNLMHEVDFVPDTMRGHQLLDLFIMKKRHMAAVVDEYGGFEGVVTLEDVLECLLGSEIVDESDRHADMQQWARERAGTARRVVRRLTAPKESGSKKSHDGTSAKA